MEKVLPLVEPRTDRVWVRVGQAEDGGRSMVMEPRALHRLQVHRDGARPHAVGGLPVGAGVAVNGVGGDVGLGVAGRGDRLVECQVGGGGDPGARQRHGQRAARCAAVHRQRPGWPPRPRSARTCTLTVQEAPAASEVPQLFDSLNGPVTPIEDIDAALLPGLDTVTDCAALVDPVSVVAERHARRRRRQGAAAAARRRRGRPRTPTAARRPSRCCR